MPSPSPYRALTIAGSDPSGGAGMQADMAVFTRLGLHPMGVATASTVQNSTGVKRVVPLADEVLREQIDAILDDMPPQAIKTGMLAGDRTVRVVLDALRPHPTIPLVVDPVRQASSGAELISDQGFQRLKAELLARATVITPNREEAEMLLDSPIHTLEAAIDAARALGRQTAVLLTGGHLDTGATLTDILVTDTVTLFRHPRHPGPSPHGTGCALSAALAAYLAMGMPMVQAVGRALGYMDRAVAGASRPGKGRPYLAAGDPNATITGVKIP